MSIAKKIAAREARARWLAKPGNREKQRAAVKRCRERAAAKEAHRIRMRSYAAENREKERVRVAKWRKEHPEKHAATHRTYYLKNKDRIKAAVAVYRSENKDSFREYSRQYKGRKRAGGGRLKKGYLHSLLTEQNYLCKACASDLRTVGYHLDHIVPIAKGGKHCDSNVQLLCPDCNRRKSDHDFEYFLSTLKREAA